MRIKLFSSDPVEYDRVFCTTLKMVCFVVDLDVILKNPKKGHDSPKCDTTASGAATDSFIQL